MQPIPQGRHIMQLARKHDSGAEEWYCPVCGRRFLLTWPPQFKRIILEPGDSDAIHTGGSAEVPSHTVDTLIADPQVEGEDFYLDIWRDWFDRVDFESWWHRGE